MSKSKDEPKWEPKGLKVKPINNGTVIDHIAGGQALNVLKILGISGTTDAMVSVVMNVDSRKLGKKDIVKVEDRELLEEEVNRIALIAPAASINIIRDCKVIEKRRVDLPDEIVGVVRCQNPNCISNTLEPIKSRMLVKAKNPVLLRCLYCEQPLTDRIADYLI
jgi:aspartate carbamoyltransferase regulatory subunit